MIPLGILAAAGAQSSAFELISTTVLTSTTATVNISSIPQDYKHLQLRIVSQTTDNSVAHSMRMRFNDSSLGIYRVHTLKGDGSVMASSTITAAQQFGFMTAGTNASAFGAHIMDLMNYTNSTTFKTARMMTSISATSGEGRGIYLESGLFGSETPITSISMEGNSFKIGSRFSLYGVRG